MKNKSVKKLAVVVALVVTCGLMVGCGKANVEEAGATVESQSIVETEEDAVVESAVEAQESQEEDSVQESEVVQEPDAALSANWEDMQFVFGGKTYQLPVSYKELEADGWSFDLADYGYEDGYILNAGDAVYSTIKLTNPNYSERLSLSVGIKNCGDSAADIKDCDIWSFDFDTCYAFKQVESFPDMTIGNGITLGSTKEDVEAACGPCDDIYESTDNGYAVYSYDIDFTYYLKITVYDEMGVTAFKLDTYK